MHNYFIAYGWEQLALPIEQLGKEQPVDERALNIQFLRPDTPAKVVQAKMAQQLNASLTSAGDALLGFRRTESKEARKTLWQE
jgi:hypothetical protein